MIHTTHARTAVACLAILLVLSAPLRAADALLRVVHWSMEGWFDSPAVLDSTPDAFDGFMVGFAGDGTEFMPGPLGRGLRFDGVQSVELPVVQPGNEGTIVHWLRPASDAGLQVAMYLSDHSEEAGENYDGFGLGGSGLEIHTGIREGQFFGLFQDGLGPANEAGSGRRQVQGGTVVPDRWTHVALTWARSGLLTLWVDCVAVDSVDMSTGVWAGHTVTEAFLGRPSDGDRFWQGGVDELALDVDSRPNAEYPDPPYAWNEEILGPLCTPRQGEVDRIRESTPQEHAQFGSHLALSGGTLAAVGSSLQWFERSGRTEWAPVADSGAGAVRGHPIVDDVLDMDGDLTLHVTGGVVRLYEQDLGGPSAWGERTTFSPDVDDEGDFGASAAVFADTVAIGSPAGSEGSVYVYRRNQGGADAWGRVKRIGVGEGVQGFGSVLDGVGDLLAIGSFGTLVLLYERDLDGPDSWSVSEALFAPLARRLAFRDEANLLVTNHSGVDPRQPASVVRIERKLNGGLRLGEQRVPRQLLGHQNDWYATWLDDDHVAVAYTYKEAGLEPVMTELVHLYARPSDPMAEAWDLIHQFAPSTFEPSYQIPQTGLGRGLVATEDGTLLVGAPLDGRTWDLGATPAPDEGSVVIFSLQIFADGFESGDTSAWSAAVP